MSPLSSSHGRQECVEFICDTDVEGLIIDWADHQGQTPLHYAVRGGRLPLVQLLLDAGADPNLTDKHHLDPEEYVLMYMDRWYAYVCIGMHRWTPPLRPSYSEAWDPLILHNYIVI